MYKRSVQGWLKHSDFVFLDVFSLLISFVIAYLIRFGGTMVYSFQQYISLAVVMTLIDFMVPATFNTMHNVLKRDVTDEAMMTLRHAILVFAATATYIFAVHYSEYYSRLMVLVAFEIYLFVSFGLRMLRKKLVLNRGVKEAARAVLLVTDYDGAEEFLESVRRHPLDNIKITGIVFTDCNMAGEIFIDVPVVANMSDAAEYICREWIDEVFFYHFSGEYPQSRLVEQCRKMAVTIHTVLPIQKEMGNKQFVEKLVGYHVITNSINSGSTMQLFFKRVIDIIGGLVGSVIALIIMAIYGPKIKKESPGPILYKQDRIGQNGRRFKMIKLRSMYVDADSRKAEYAAMNRVEDGRMFKLDWDPRIIGNKELPDGTRVTGIGEFIRRTSLDEFPQFFNVLKGDMSLVGTRPPTVDEWDKYELHHRARLSIRPGITGLWQISGRSEITDFEEVVRLDTEYIENWNTWLDIKIIFKTIGAVLGRRGAM